MILQPMHIEVSVADQTLFLPPREILDNVPLTHETLSWTKQSNQEIVFKV
jgi:hypothetical protein